MPEENTIEARPAPGQRYRDREREIKLEAAVRRFWNFVRGQVPLDSLTEDDQDECWALDKLGRELLEKKP